jgi:hypothetical protein
MIKFSENIKGGEEEEEETIELTEEALKGDEQDFKFKNTNEKQLE